MTEGPQAKLQALRVARALGGKRVVEVVSKREEFKVLAGKALEQVETVGKNIVLIFGEKALRIHLLMFGRLDACESREACAVDRLRLMLVFDGGALSVSRQASLELGEREMLERLKNILGPDPLGSWSEEEFLRRLTAKGEEKVGAVLLDQTVAAGIGNILRNEILFLSGISPERLVRELSPEEAKLLAETTFSYTQRYFQALLEGRRERELHSVYMRAKRPCPKCGTHIKMFYQEPHGRKTFYCPSCQK